MTKERKKLFGLLLLLCAACIFLMACRAREKAQEPISGITEDSAAELEEDVKQLESDEEEPLVVFYDGGLFKPTVLENFQLQHPEVSLQTYRIHGTDMEGIQETLDQYGEPDIWLIKANSGIREEIDNLDDQGLIADIRPFIIEDVNLDTLDYVGGTFTAMDNGEALLGLPLTWKKTCMIIRDSKWQDSELAYIPENYTGEELYKAFITEYELGQPNDGIFWADRNFDLMQDLYELGLVKKEDDEIFIDEDLFAMVYEFTLSQQKVSQDAWYMGGSGADNPDQFQGTPALDPSMYAGNYYGCHLTGAPQVTSVYAKSATQLHGEDIYMYYMPTYKSSDEYIAEVGEFAMVGGTSTRQQQAYEVIRLMMDTPMELVYQPQRYDMKGATYSPVNIELAIQMMDYFGSLEMNLPIHDMSGNLFYTLNKAQLDNREKQQIEELIRGIVDLSIQYGDHPEMDLYDVYYQDYIYNDGDLNTKLCYFELMRAMNPESEKWDMTPEEIEAFVNEE